MDTGNKDLHVEDIMETGNRKPSSRYIMDTGNHVEDIMDIQAKETITFVHVLFSSPHSLDQSQKKNTSLADDSLCSSQNLVDTPRRMYILSLFY